MTARRATTRYCADHTQYTAGCEGCRYVTRRYAKQREVSRQPGRLDPTGTVRRLQALAWMGWSASAIGQRAGCTQQKIAHWQNGQVRWVFAPTVVKVMRVYDELCMTDGGCDRARARAVAAGWVGPLHWDDHAIDDPAATPLGLICSTEPIDPVAIARVLEGDRTVRLTDGEKQEVARMLLDQGRGVTAIANALHVSGTTARDLITNTTQEVAA